MGTPPVYFQIVSRTCTSWLWHLPLHKPGLFLHPWEKGSFCLVGRYPAKMPFPAAATAPDLQTELTLSLGFFAWKTAPEPSVFMHCPIIMEWISHLAHFTAQEAQYCFCTRVHFLGTLGRIFFKSRPAFPQDPPFSPVPPPPDTSVCANISVPGCRREGICSAHLSFSTKVGAPQSQDWTPRHSGDGR